LEIRAEPADEAALFFGGALVVEGDEVGEDGLFERLGIGTARIEAKPSRLVVSAHPRGRPGCRTPPPYPGAGAGVFFGE
jgi:hypothetical protein